MMKKKTDTKKERILGSMIINDTHSMLNYLEYSKQLLF